MSQGVQHYHLFSTWGTSGLGHMNSQNRPTSQQVELVNVQFCLVQVESPYADIEVIMEAG